MECPVCYERAKQTLNCGHQVCLDCLSKLTIYLCPLCREPITWTRGNIADYRDDVKDIEPKPVINVPWTFICPDDTPPEELENLIAAFRRNVIEYYKAGTPTHLHYLLEEIELFE